MALLVLGQNRLAEAVNERVPYRLRNAIVTVDGDLGSKLGRSSPSACSTQPNRQIPIANSGVVGLVELAHPTDEASEVRVLLCQPVAGVPIDVYTLARRDEDFAFAWIFAIETDQANSIGGSEQADFLHGGFLDVGRYQVAEVGPR